MLAAALFGTILAGQLHGRPRGYAAYTVIPPDASALTATYTVNLLTPAAGQRFEITGEVIRAGRTLVVCRGEAFADGSQRPFAVIQATMSVLRNRPGISG